MELYKKHRPKTFKELVGNSSTVKSLEQKIEKNNLPHAILLTGESGTGKTTVGRIIGDAIGVNPLDFAEIDTADFRGIDTIRSIRRQMYTAPQSGKYRMWLLDEAHQIGQGGSSSKNPAQSALLKALEETPKHVYFILCTTDPQLLMKTIKSRCIHFEMELLNEQEMMVLLTRVCKKEKVLVPKQVKRKIVTLALGRPRRALTLLEKIIDLNPDEMKVQLKDENTIEAEAIDLARILFKGGSYQKAIEILKGLENENPETIRKIILKYMLSIIMKGKNERAHDLIFFFKDPFYEVEDGKVKLWYTVHGILNNFNL